jgi:hypothetical protein
MRGWAAPHRSALPNINVLLGLFIEPISAVGVISPEHQQARRLMKTLISTLCAATVAISGLAVAVPAEAASPVGSAQFQQVANHHPRFERHGSYAYLNGHRGDRHFHKGYRQYNGYWFPPASFIGFAIGAVIVGGLLSHAY